MSTLEDTIRSVVQDFMKAGVLFTALDVSNTVKQVMPNAKHRDVRDVVRGLFTTEIEPQSWARTPIQVELKDGTTTEALLYHPLSDSWDLDSKYDAQRRALTSYRPVAAAQATLAQAQAQAQAQQVVTAPVAASTVVTAPAPAPMPTARTLWDNLFQTQPSLFPHK